MAATKPWHKRWHGNALNGMRGLSLELRGAYNSILDLMYDHGGPISLNERRLCGELECDLRVLRRVIPALISAGKLRLWTDGNGVWIVNNKVLETLSIKGFSVETCGRLTADLRDKFAIANAELSPKSDENHNENSQTENNSSEKMDPRGRGRRKEPPIVPQGDDQLALLPDEPEPPDDLQLALSLWNDTAALCDLPKAKDLTDRRRKHLKARLAEHGLAGWAEALAAVTVSAFLRGIRTDRGGRPFRADLDFVLQAKSFQRLREGFYGEDAEPPRAAVPADPHGPWRGRLLDWSKNRYWNTVDWGPKPGQPGCEAPVELLVAEVDTRAPFPSSVRSAA